MLNTFKYKAVNNRGEIFEGTYIAESKDEVINMIREGQQLPVKIEEVKSKSKAVGDLNIFKPKVRIKELAVFCKQFHTMLNAGMALTNCLEVLMEQTENKTLKTTIEDIFTQVQKGSLLSEAMKGHKKIFPSIFINMVEAGEMTGSLDEVLNRMAEHFEKENKINSKIKNAMVYPVILSIVSIIVVIFLLVFIMPTFIDMFTSSGIELPLATRILLSFSNTLTKYWYLFVIIIAAMVFLFKKILNTHGGKKLFD